MKDNQDLKIVSLKVEPDKLIAKLADDREIAIPRSWLDLPQAFNLNHATTEQLEDYKIIGNGKTVYFPKVEEFLGLHTFLGGLQASCSSV